MEIGKEAGLDLKYEDGKIKVVGNYDGKGFDADVILAADPGYFLDKLAKIIPGDYDDKIFAALKVMFKVP